MTKDMTSTIIPKSDQLNSDDLIGGRTLTIKITGVSIVMGDQPVALSYEGDNGKPYKPGKSMRRVLVSCWGADANLYVGRYLTLYRDEKVTFGGSQVGGIRISHMSHIPEARTMALTATKAVRKPFTVQPLTEPKPAANQTEEVDLDALKSEARAMAYSGTAALMGYWKGLGRAKQSLLEPFKEEYKAIASKCDATPSGDGDAA